jgi:hypothetical protein
MTRKYFDRQFDFHDPSKKHCINCNMLIVKDDGRDARCNYMKIMGVKNNLLGFESVYRVCDNWIKLETPKENQCL